MNDLDLADQHILLVDDVFYARETIKRIFFSLGNPEVTEATDGMKALAEIKEHKATLTMLVVDFAMPHMNGLELIKKVRMGQTPLPRHFPCAMLTGYGERELVDMALGLDINAFLIKPVSRRALADRLIKILEMEHDRSWLKEVEEYQDARIKHVGAYASPQQAAREAQRPAADPMAMPTPTKAETPKANAAPRPITPKGAGGEETVRRFEDTDKAASHFASQLDSLKNRFEDPKDADRVTTGAGRLVVDTGPGPASQVITTLSTLETKSMLGLKDLAKVLGERQPALIDNPHWATRPNAPTNPPSKARDNEAFFGAAHIPDGALLARPLLTTDGSTLLDVQTPLTDEVIALLARIDQFDLVMMDTAEADLGAGRGLFVETAQSPGKERIRAMDASEIRAGVTLARDLYIADGRLFVTKGVTITPRIGALLQDMVQMECLDTKLWVYDKD